MAHVMHTPHIDSPSGTTDLDGKNDAAASGSDPFQQGHVDSSSKESGDWICTVVRNNPSSCSAGGADEF
eukprot:7198965-Karenia_brevis.AAC.1